MLRHLILGLLRYGGPRHGYALMKAYREASGRQINVGNFYREFQRLRLEELVRPVRNPDGADARRVPYDLTPLGAAEFDAWLARPAVGVPVDYENEYSLRAFFVLRSAHPLTQRVLDHWFEELSAQHRSFQAACEEAKGDRDPAAPLPLWLGRRLNHLAIDLEFVETLRAACAARAARRSDPPRDAGPVRTPARRAG